MAFWKRGFLSNCSYFVAVVFVAAAFVMPVQAQSPTIISNSGDILTKPVDIQSHTIKLDNVTLTTGSINLKDKETIIVISGAMQARKSGPICGGYGSDGKMQPRCGNKPATFTSAARGTCPKGTFFDIGKWGCYSCPSGFKRTITAVDSDRACRKRNKKNPRRIW